MGAFGRPLHGLLLGEAPGQERVYQRLDEGRRHAAALRHPPLVPAGVALVVRPLPSGVLAECREQNAQMQLPAPANRLAAVVVVAVWLLAASRVVLVLRSLLSE